MTKLASWYLTSQKMVTDLAQVVFPFLLVLALLRF